MTSSAPSVSTIVFPIRGSVLERSAAADFVAALRAWMSVCTDRVLALDAQWQTIGPDASPTEQADVAASFLAHKAIGTRIDEMRTDAGLKQVVELCHRPVFADDGSAVAANVSDACVLLEAIVDRAESSLQRTAATVHESVRLRGAVNGDLAVAEHLAQRLGDQVRHVSGLRARADATIARLAGNDPGDSMAELAALAGELVRVRASLEAADAERQRMIASWSSLPARIGQLAAREADVRELRARCEEKVRPVPNLAIPSVATLPAPMPIDQLESRPWTAVEPECRPYLTKLDRVEAALAEAQRRFAAPLRERDELRGLVQAFHDKAGAAGLDEHTDLDPAYRTAVDQLWSAPCDLDIARELVQRYVAAVNLITNGETARPVATPDVPSTGDPTP